VVDKDLAAVTWTGFGGGVGFWSTGVIVALVTGLAGRAGLLAFGAGLGTSAFACSLCSDWILTIADL